MFYVVYERKKEWLQLLLRENGKSSDPTVAVHKQIKMHSVADCKYIPDISTPSNIPSFTSLSPLSIRIIVFYNTASIIACASKYPSSYLIKNSRTVTPGDFLVNNFVCVCVRTRVCVCLRVCVLGLVILYPHLYLWQLYSWHSCGPGSTSGSWMPHRLRQEDMTLVTMGWRVRRSTSLLVLIFPSNFGPFRCCFRENKFFSSVLQFNMYCTSVFLWEIF